MKEITSEIILKDIHYKKQMIIHTIFCILGLSTTFLPLLYLRAINFNSVIGTLFCFVVFGIPIGIFCGLYRMIKVQKIKTKINNHQYKIISDIVVDKELTNGSGVADDSDDYCMLTFQNYSEKTNKCIRVTLKTYRKTKIGDKYYLVYIDGMKTPIYIYPAEEYIY